MNQPVETTPNSRQFTVDAAIRIGFIALIVVWCFNIFKPFITIFIWSSIIAIFSYPLVRSLARMLGNNMKAAIAIFVLIGLSLVALPGVLLTGSIMSTGKEVVNDIEEATLKIGPPDISVRDWPVLGERIYNAWSDASDSLERFVQEHKDQVKTAVGWLFRGLALIGLDVLLTLISILLAALLMSHADALYKASVTFFNRMLSQQGEPFATSARDTVRSVVKGVVLVSVIQAFLAWIGFYLVDLPAAGVWAAIVLIMAIMQLPVIILMLPLIIYVFSVNPGTAAVIFAVWSILVGVSDSVLKPMFLGKGMSIPMLVILIGALGGMVMYGMVGLFIGAVVLSIGYQIYLLWVNNWEINNEETAIHED